MRVDAVERLSDALVDFGLEVERQSVNFLVFHSGLVFGSGNNAHEWEPGDVEEEDVELFGKLEFGGTSGVEDLRSKAALVRLMMSLFSDLVRAGFERLDGDEEVVMSDGETEVWVSDAYEDYVAICVIADGSDEPKTFPRTVRGAREALALATKGKG